MQAKFLFGDIVVVQIDQIGVILRTWKMSSGKYEYEVYNRMTDQIETYSEGAIDRYRVRHKYLNEEEMKYQYQ
ncbi:MAG: hypothetical protein GX638_18020 [Crenarchaeota archaeon]|nr:hypothetical protein [Thermoproteota archaeon]